MEKTLWSRNYTIITIGSFISALGGTATNLALSLVVFDNTGSALLTSIFTVVSLLPTVLFPTIIAPYMDAHPRLPFIYRIDLVNGLIFVLFGFYVARMGFQYNAYMMMGFVLSCLSTVYHVAYASLYPDLIPKGFLQKGYSVSSLIYPFTMVLMTPVATLIYTYAGIEYLFMLEGILLVIASIAERFIKLDETDLLKPKTKFSFKQYTNEMKAGYHYLRKEKGVSALYLNMAIMNGTSTGGQIMQMSFFQTSPMLGAILYSVFIGANTLGRLIGGLLHYFFKIPKDKRFLTINIVYKLYSTLDAIILFLPFTVMVGVQCFTGILGVNSATLREAAIQNHIPRDIRARINALLGVLIAISGMMFRLLAGILAEFMDYRSVFVAFSLLSLVMSIVFVDRRREEIKQFMNVEF